MDANEYRRLPAHDLLYHPFVSQSSSAPEEQKFSAVDKPHTGACVRVRIYVYSGKSLIISCALYMLYAHVRMDVHVNKLRNTLSEFHTAAHVGFFLLGGGGGGEQCVKK